MTDACSAAASFLPQWFSSLPISMKNAGVSMYGPWCVASKQMLNSGRLHFALIVRSALLMRAGADGTRVSALPPSLQSS